MRFERLWRRSLYKAVLSRTTMIGAFRFQHHATLSKIDIIIDGQQVDEAHQQTSRIFQNKKGSRFKMDEKLSREVMKPRVSQIIEDYTCRRCGGAVLRISEHGIVEIRCIGKCSTPKSPGGELIRPPPKSPQGGKSSPEKI